MDETDLSDTKSDDVYQRISAVRFDICRLILFRWKKTKQWANVQAKLCSWKTKKKRFLEASDREIKRLFDNLLPKIQERSKCICLMKLIGGLQNK